MKFNFQKINLKSLGYSQKKAHYFSIETIIVTFFFVGLIPLAPGTMGTLAVYPIYYYITELEPIKSLNLESLKDQVIYLLWALAIALTVIGTWAIAKYQKQTKTYDHKAVVIDEVIGMLIVLAISFEWLYEISNFILPYSDFSLRTIMFFVGFAVFRFFDITKPLIIGFVDARVKHPFGVILDDILAAFFASGVLFVIAQIIGVIS